MPSTFDQPSIRISFDGGFAGSASGEDSARDIFNRRFVPRFGNRFGLSTYKMRDRNRLTRSRPLGQVCEKWRWRIRAKFHKSACGPIHPAMASTGLGNLPAALHHAIFA